MPDHKNVIDLLEAAEVDRGYVIKGVTLAGRDQVTFVPIAEDEYEAEIRALPIVLYWTATREPAVGDEYEVAAALRDDDGTLHDLADDVLLRVAEVRPPDDDGCPVAIVEIVGTAE